VDTSVVYVRTPKGQEAFNAGNSELSSAQRTALIMVDGQRPAADIVKAISAIGNGFGLLAQLADLGMIAPQFTTARTAKVLPLAQNARAPHRMSEGKLTATKTLSDQRSVAAG
jgi:hypothetical protein